MNVRMKVGFAAVLFVGNVLFFAPVTSAQHEGHDHDAGEGHDEEAKMMEMWAKMGAPGEHHKQLEPFAGKWSYLTKWRMSPEQPWGESRGSAVFEWVMGGRFLLQHIKGEDEDPMMGRFEGMGFLGYDNATHKHVSTWIDTMGTGVMLSEGSCDESGKVFTLVGSYFDPMIGKETKAKSISRIISNDKHVFEMYGLSEKGEEFKTLEVTYTRK